jgi:hypothetical protein
VTPSAEQVALVDAPESAGRTTATLLGSLTARLAALHLISGADALGSLVAGYAALGREVARTAEGARMKRALESGRAGRNGDLLWSRLRLVDWASTMAPSPVLDQLRNDAALLLADDVETTLDLLPIPGEIAGSPAALDERWTFADFLLGFWAFSAEVVRVVEALAAPTLAAAGEVLATGSVDPEADGELLR